MTVAPTFTARQTELLAAAVRLVAASGLRGLTHRGVDREAGLPEGTCSAYMRTRVALVTGLTSWVSSRYAADIEALTSRIEQHAQEEGYAVAETEAMLLGWLADPDLLRVRMELALEGSRQREVGDLLHTQHQRLVTIVAHAMEVSGHEHGRDRAITLTASIDGLLLRALREPAEHRDRFLGQSLGLLMRALAGIGEAPTH